MKETIPKSQFDDLLWNAVITEQLLGIHGLQQVIINKYNVQLEFAYDEL